MAYEQIAFILSHYGKQPSETLRPSLAGSTSLSSERLLAASSNNSGGSASGGRKGRAVKVAGDSDGKAPPAAPDLTSLVTVADAARDLRISQRHLRRLIAAEQVRVVRFGRAVRIPRDELERLVKTGLPASVGAKADKL